MMEFLLGRFKYIFSNDFFLAFIILIAYLCTNGYAYGWDDQHLEIPLLKHLIDPSLYKGDYYVESLTKNFSSYLYPILSKFITVAQIPTVYFVLFLFSRYWMFFWILKLWNLISKDKFAAFCATLMFFLLGRTEEFIYRTFSHQEFAIAIMSAGFYFFYREKFILAAVLFGLAANFNAIYNLFPMFYMMIFLILFHPKRWVKLLQTTFFFIVFCLPFLIWQIPKSLNDKFSKGGISFNELLSLYLPACPENFLFLGRSLNEALRDPLFILNQLKPHFYLIVLYIFLLLVFPKLREDRKTNILVLAGFGLVIFSFIFIYLIPTRFVVDLNLMRSEQFIQLFLMAYLTFWTVQFVKQEIYWKAFIASLIFIIIGFGDIFHYQFKIKLYIVTLILVFLVFIVLCIKRWSKWDPILRKTLIVIPIVISFIGFCKFNYNYIQAKKHNVGYWQFLNNWIDMQIYVRDHTPKEVLILVPINTDTGGFRIHSERKIVVCARDSGIVGFDYKAAKEWSQRMDDLKDFIVMTNKQINQAVITSIIKYKVDYIVFMRYYEPRYNNPIFQKIYQNEVFSLYKINIKL